MKIHHNLAVQSNHNPGSFLQHQTLQLLKKGTAETKLGYYETKTRFSFVRNANMKSFL